MKKKSLGSFFILHCDAPLNIREVKKYGNMEEPHFANQGVGLFGIHAASRGRLSIKFGIIDTPRLFLTISLENAGRLASSSQSQQF